MLLISFIDRAILRSRRASWLSYHIEEEEDTLEDAHLPLLIGCVHDLLLRCALCRWISCLFVFSSSLFTFSFCRSSLCFAPLRCCLALGAKVFSMFVVARLTTWLLLIAGIVRVRVRYTELCVAYRFSCFVVCCYENPDS